jgi:hypothetical protein
MDPSAQIALAIDPGVRDTTATPLVKVDNGGPSIGTDFSAMLDGFRKRADALDASNKAILAKPADALTSNEKSIKQLADLYTYAVDMQVMVKTGGQLTSGMRQLITGQ